jgi:adenylosuccinate lyase
MGGWQVHAKLEARSSVIVRQEQAIGGHEKERARLERELKTTQGTLDEARRGAEQTTHVSSRVEAELAETKTLLKDSQSMVSWLNKEVSKAKSSQTIEGAMQRTLTSGRAPLATKAINADSSRRVEYSRSKPEPLSDKYLVQIAPTKKVVSVERSFIPRVAPPTVPTSSENPTSIR